jgi:PAS domain S-box-containing protein
MPLFRIRQEGVSINTEDLEGRPVNSILYVDDELALLEIGKIFLEQSGQFSVDTITSAPDALSLLNSKTYDAIVSDYQMPEMDGIAFLKAIREGHHDIPFILFTGRGREEVVIEAINNGADFYLQKGGDLKSQFAELAHKIRQAIARRQAERSLIESEKRLFDIINFLPDATFAIDKSGRVIAWNRAIEDMTGIPAKQILGKGDYEYAIPFYGKRQPILIDLLFESEDIISRNYTHILHDKDTLIAETMFPRQKKRKALILLGKASPLYNQQGDIVGAIEILRDVTDYRQTESELRESEERYRNVIEDQTEFLCRFRPDGTHVFVNEAYCRYFGRRREEIIGQRFQPVIPLEDQDRVKRFFASLTLEHPVDSIEHRIIMSDGSIRWQRWSDRAVFDKDSHIREYQSVGTDITDKKNAEHALQTAYEQITAAEEELRNQYDELKDREQVIRESEQKLQGIVHGSPIPQFVLDKSHRVISWNRALEDYSGVKARDVLGTTHAWKAFYDRERPILSSLLMENAPEKIQELYAGKLNKSKYVDDAYEVTDFFPRMGGHGIWLHFTAALIRDSIGNIIGAVETLEDITERKKAEEELQGSYAQITASEEELRQQYDELKKSEDALSESERKLQGIVQGSPIPQFVIDKNHRVISWNRALEAYSGVKADEVLGTTHAWKAFYDRKRPVLSNLLVENKPEKIQELYAGKSNESKYVDDAYEVTDFFPRMGGHGIWLHFTAALIRDSIGNIIGAVETLEDITERKKAEEELQGSYAQITASEEELRQQFDELKKSEDALKGSEGKYRSILESIQDVYYRSDTAGNLIMVSPSIVPLLGFDPVSELIGKNIAQSIYYNPEERSKFLDELNNRGFVTDYEVILKKRDGTPVPVATSSHKYFDPYGNFLGVEGVFRDITERKRMEESLRANEEKYRSLVDNLNVGVYRNTLELPGRWLWANPAFVRMLGYDSLHECLEQPVTNIYADPDERKKFIQVMEADGFVSNYELQLKKKDGSQIWVSITAQGKKNQEGKIQWIDGICEDITVLKIAEERIRHYQFEMSRAIDYLPDATFIIDRKGTVVAWNRAIEKLTGVRTEDIIGKGDYEYAIPFYGVRRPILIDLIFASKDELKNGEYIEIHRNGEILSVETPNPILKGKPSVVRAIAAPIYDEFGDINGAIETITDITELKQAQENLRVSENRYRTIFENTGTATVLIDENTLISIANAEFERLSGFSRDELEGKKRWTEFVLNEDMERMLAQHRLRRERHETALRHYEFRFVTKNGEIRNIFLTIDLIPGTKQSVASLMDITVQVNAQDAYRQANRKLNLLNSVTRHDVLNSLTALISNIQMSRQSTKDPVILNYITKEEMAAENIQNQILFTQNYQEIGVHSPEWQQIGDTIHKSLAALDTGDIVLSVDVEDVEIFADLLLGKVFYTLVENAVRHGETVKKIWFTTEKTEDALKIVCEDDGKGVPSEAKEQIFKKRYYKHTGLGLFFTREILEITGITIRETGTKGKGARFEILVPKGVHRFANSVKR